jgi:23S rRNA (cytidine1920-2'-O)/16S rRNA (cytidine1409-2'-O)-methyltransferase
VQPPARSSRTRLDEALVERGLAPTRSKARALILAGDILVNQAVSLRAGQLVSGTDELALAAKPRFVSRGGEKLDHALSSFGVDAAGVVAADLGASTGGFTDCLLQRGAAKVYAVDVGYGQIDPRLRLDERVVVMERTNARNLEPLPEPIDLATIDVSFISLGLIFPAVTRILRPGGQCVPLIKPQFEAGRKEVGKGGVVRDPDVHRRVLEGVVERASQHGLRLRGLVASPLLGPAGNVEFLAQFVGELGASGEAEATAMIDAVMTEAAALTRGEREA